MNSTGSSLSPPPHIMEMTRVTSQASAIVITSRNNRLTLGMSETRATKFAVSAGASISPHTGARSSAP